MRSDSRGVIDHVDLFVLTIASVDRRWASYSFILGVE
jgi:hypothetical protein